MQKQGMNADEGERLRQKTKVGEDTIPSSFALIFCPHLTRCCRWTITHDDKGGRLSFSVFSVCSSAAGGDREARYTMHDSGFNSYSPHLPGYTGMTHP